MNYRADIDGLRAIAVLAVLAFHLKVGASGGFVGVDVFFVISGYLISSIIYSDVAHGTFSVTKFYQRRALRILPALIAVVLVTLIAATLEFFPSEFSSFVASAIASLLFSANVYFFAINDYFSPTADTVPLLHIWSLGIEEQFYFLFPPLIIGCARFAPKHLTSVLIALFLASLVACEIMLGRSPTAAFYLLPFRAFELLVGCLSARQKPTVALPHNASEVLGGLGLLLIAIAIVLFKSDGRFPGLAALIPCLGAAMIIAAGMRNRTMASQLLALRPVVFVGKISYSLYLIHWPVLVFLLRAFPKMPHLAFAFVVTVLSVGLATLNYYFVERPFRSKTRSQSPWRSLAIAGGAIAVSVLVLSISPSALRFYRPLNVEVARVISYLNYDPKPAFRSQECFMDPDQDLNPARAATCLPRGAGIPVVLWGDSHAADIYAGLKESLQREGYSLGMLAASACSPIIGYTFAPRPKCPSFNNAAFAMILAAQPQIVILSAAWIITSDSMQLLDRTVHDLTSRRIKVVLLGESPLYRVAVPTTLAARIGAKDPNRIAKGDDLWLDRMKDTDAIMAKMFGNRSDVTFIALTPLICPKDECPIATPDGLPLLFDTEHFTVEGAKYYAKFLMPLIIR